MTGRYRLCIYASANNPAHVTFSRGGLSFALAVTCMRIYRSTANHAFRFSIIDEVRRPQ